MTPQFDYDVAFSFLAADEGIAVRQCWIAPNWERKQLDSDELAEELVKRYLDISQTWKAEE
jgi:hypothetical protein